MKNLRTPIKVIIDTDPGVDDAFAILYALNRPEFEVLGITSIFGNAGIDLCTRNALALLELAGRTDIPVARGLANPLGKSLAEWEEIRQRFPRGAMNVHGDNGLGGAELPEPQVQPIDLPAMDFILETVKRYPGEIVLVPLGRLTNVAAAIIKDRATMEKLAGICLMGGTVRAPGNSTAVAEANIYGDPDAADLVMTLDVPKVMVGLDVTMKAIFHEADTQRLKSFNTKQGNFLVECSRHYDAFYRHHNPHLDGFSIHDVLPFTYLLHPELFEVKDAYVRVETRGRFTTGQTVADLRAFAKDKPNCTVCLDVDHRAVIEDFLETMSKSK